MSEPSNPMLTPTSSGVNRPPNRGPQAPTDANLQRPMESGVDVPQLLLDMVSYHIPNCIGHPFTRAVSPEMLRQVSNLLTTTRWLYITNQETAQETWNSRIAQDANLLEYVLRLTQVVSFHLRGWNLYEVAVDLVAQSVALPEGKSSVYHDALAKRLSPVNDVRNLLLENPWLLVLQLGAMSEGASTLGRIASPKQPVEAHVTTPEAS